MSVDRPPKRKTASKADAASPEKPAKQTRPQSRTADNLEALLHLLDEGEGSDAAPPAAQKPHPTPSGRALKPAQEKTSAAGEGASFMQELARARAGLHQERRARIALEEEVKSLRRELSQLAAIGSAKVSELRRASEALRKQLAAVEKQREQLNCALLNAESELEAEQRQRELLNDQVETLRRRLDDIEPRPDAC